jgi:hypothetical protein
MTSTLPILTIDLGKFNAVLCWYEPEIKATDFRTVRAARDHAFTTRETLGTPELLPRPSQQDLARRAGLTETDVSRCL